MPSMATVTLVGHAGGEPEIRYTADGSAISSFSVAVNERQKNRDTGEWEDAPASWYKVTAFGALGTRVSERVGKGTLVYVQGRLSTSTWKGRDGETRVSLQVRASDVLALERDIQTDEERRDPVRVGSRTPAPARQAALDDLEDLPF